MTTADTNPKPLGFETSRGDWLDSVATGTERRDRIIGILRTWVTERVFGVEAPEAATYTRFEGQSSQVPNFAEQHRPVNLQAHDEQELPLSG